MILGPTILGIDTGTPFISVGLWSEDGARLSRAVPADRLHAERLPGAVEDLLREAGGPAVRLVAVGTGPGSYTGLRIGASLALGLARGWGVPVVGVGTLEAIASRADGPVAVSLDARRGLVYGALFSVRGGRPEPDGPAGKFPAAEFEALAAGRPRLHDVAPDGADLARLAERVGRPDWSLVYG